MSESQLWAQQPVTNKHGQVSIPGTIVVLSDSYLCIDNALEPDRYKWLMKRLRVSTRPQEVFRTPTKSRFGTGIQVFLSTMGKEPKAPGNVVRLESIISISFCSGHLMVEYLVAEGETRRVDIMSIEQRAVIEIFRSLRECLGFDVRSSIERNAGFSLLGSESRITVTRQTPAIPPPLARAREPLPSDEEVLASLASLEIDTLESKTRSEFSIEPVEDERNNKESADLLNLNHDNQAKSDTILHRALRVPVAAFVLVAFVLTWDEVLDQLRDRK